MECSAPSSLVQFTSSSFISIFVSLSCTKTEFLIPRTAIIIFFFLFAVLTACFTNIYATSKLSILKLIPIVFSFNTLILCLATLKLSQEAFFHFHVVFDVSRASSEKTVEATRKLPLMLAVWRKSFFRMYRPAPLPAKIPFHAASADSSSALISNLPVRQAVLMIRQLAFVKAGPPPFCRCSAYP